MKKSPLFQFILSCCQAPEEIAKNKPVSINVFFGTVLKALAIGAEAFEGTLSKQDAQNALEELHEVAQLVSAHTIDYVQAHDNLFSYIASNSGGFLDNYLYAKIITEFEIEKPATYALTVADVCKKILNEPTKAISYALNLSGEQPSQTTSSEEIVLTDELLDSLLSGAKPTATPTAQPAETPTAPKGVTGGKQTGMIADIVKRTDSIPTALAAATLSTLSSIKIDSSGCKL